MNKVSASEPFSPIIPEPPSGRADGWGAPHAKISLEEERYLSIEGPIHLTGIQALVRLHFDVLRLLRGIYPQKRFAYFVSGYEGSPLGGLDINLRRLYPILKQWKIIHVPGGNEEAAANMVWGSQLHRLFGPGKVDGVIGAWYGKGPGVRRIGDVQDHMQMAGLDKLCAAYFISGDDHTSKSSTTPHQTDLIHFANHTPVAYPGNIEEILETGKRAALVSMLSGLAVNLKLETYVCDGSQDFHLHPEAGAELIKLFHECAAQLAGYRRYFSPVLLKPAVLKNEEELLYSKLPMIAPITRALRCDRWDNRELKADFGIVATGKSYYDVLGALKQLHIAENEVEIYKPMFTWPPDMESFREFARGKREIIVIEEKRAFYESHLKNALFNDAERPVIIGKEDERGQALFRQNFNLDADSIVFPLGQRLAAKARFRTRGIERLLEERQKSGEATVPLQVMRPPAYCSGCQHRTALEISGHDAPPGGAPLVVENKDLDGRAVRIEIAPRHVMGIGIGCSTMSIIDALAGNRAAVVGPMASEGLLWMGAAAFSYRLHVDQGCGDGTFFHSARLNVSFIRDAIAHLKTHFAIDDTHQTLLYVDNNVVAMTGGQRPIGQDDPETVILNIKQEGIENVAVIAEFPEQFRQLAEKHGVPVYDRSQTQRIKEEFSQKPGLSVIWYVQKCGIEKIRERRKNEELAPRMRLHVNTDVCEDCGDCGVKAKCASVWKTGTEFGPKVRIHEFSCIQDFACAKGECPSYVKVYTRSGNPLRRIDYARIAIDSGELPDPPRRRDPEKIYEIYATGIGGWGLMTTYEILARAATQEGNNVVKEDDTGLSQKGGEVRTNLKIAAPNHALHEGFKIEAGGADLYIAADMIGAVNPENLRATSPHKTLAIVNTQKIPTMPMIVGNVEYPDPEQLRAVIDGHTLRGRNIYVNATAIVEALFNDFKPTNLFLLGMAFQMLEDFPIARAASIEEAIAINNVEIEENIQAFRYGRLYIADPARVLAALGPREETLAERLQGYRQKVGLGKRAQFETMAQRLLFDDAYQGKFAREICELLRFQDAAWAERFLKRVSAVHDIERAHFNGQGFALTKTVADNLYKLMTYKDEYRVADLLTRPEELRKMLAAYAPGEARRIRYLLRPPILRRLPWIKDLQYVRARFENDGKWEIPGWMLRLLRHGKFLRGSSFDPFAWNNPERREERKAIAVYERRVESLLPRLTARNYEKIRAALSYPDLIRGYERVRESHARRAEEFWREKLAELAGGEEKEVSA